VTTQLSNNCVVHSWGGCWSHSRALRSAMHMSSACAGQTIEFLKEMIRFPAKGKDEDV